MGTVVVILLIVGGFGIYFMSLRWQRADEKREAEEARRNEAEEPGASSPPAA